MNSNELISLVNSFLQPATTAFMVLIPSITVLYILAQAFLWYTQDEQQHQQEPFGKKVKRAIIIAVVAFSITAILKIFGINVSS